MDCDRADSLALAANIRLFIGDPHGAEAQARQTQAMGLHDDFANCLAYQTLALAAQAQTRAISIHVARDSGEGLEEACSRVPGGALRRTNHS